MSTDNLEIFPPAASGHRPISWSLHPQVSASVSENSNHAQGNAGS